MDNTVSKVLDFFKHIVRDLLIYVLSGLVIIGNLSIIDNMCNESLIFNKLLEIAYTPLVIIITAYVLGHIISSVMFSLRIIFKYLHFPIKPRVEIKEELKIFIENIEIYEYFIERQNQLYYIRRNLAGAFFISAIINLYSYYFVCKNNTVIIFGTTLFLFSISMYFFYNRALENYNSKVKNINELLKEEH